MIKIKKFSSKYNILKEEDVWARTGWFSGKHEKRKVEYTVVEDKEYVDNLVCEFLNKIGKNNIIQIMESYYFDEVHQKWVYRTRIYYDDISGNEKDE